MSQNYQDLQSPICMAGGLQPIAAGKQPVGMLSNNNLRFCPF